MPSDTKSSPTDAIVYITDTFGTDTFGQASGVLISPDEVLTASHVVFRPDLGGTASNIVVTPDFSPGNAPFGIADGTFGHFIDFQETQPDTNSSAIASQDYAVIHLSRPFIGLTPMGLEGDFQGGRVMVSGYPASLDGQLYNKPQTVTVDPNATFFDGIDPGEGSSGGPVWITDSNGNPLVVGVVSGSSSTNGSFTQITSVAFNTIETWVTEDDAPPTPGLAVDDMTVSPPQPLPPHGVPYDGPVAGVDEQYIQITTDKLNVSVATPNWFIHTGTGDDAIAVSSGTNVLDGGAGSNFLTGGSGLDTFFVDDRKPTADIWSTIVGFHAGDDVTIWGVSRTDFEFVNDQGATGFTGLTLQTTPTGTFIAKLTLAGLSQADIASGRLSINSGIDPASSSEFTVVHANS
jgi:V8-like Glu-specific endopeptidase